MAKSGEAENAITKLEITDGEVKAADWEYVAGGTPGVTASPLTKLTDLTVEPAVAKSADIPAGAAYVPVFPTTLQNVSVSRGYFVGGYSFWGSPDLLIADFPGATGVGDSTFWQCKNLKIANFPDAVALSDYSFDACQKMTTANFQKVESMGIYTFAYCYQLKTASFPKLKSIPNGGYRGCKRLLNISFPLVESIDKDAFKDCAELRVLKLGPTPPSVVGENAFLNCPIQRKIVIVDENGYPLIGSALEAAKNNYRAANDGNTNDNWWHGWSIENINTLVDIDNDEVLTMPIKVGGNLIDMILSPPEKVDPEILTIKVDVKVDVATNQTDKDLIQGIQKWKPEFTIGESFDLSIGKTIEKTDGTKTVTDVKSTSSDVEFTLGIPLKYQGGTDYQIAYVHDGNPPVLLPTKRIGNELTFGVNKFSTFAIVYKKPAGEIAPPPPTDDSWSGSFHNPPAALPTVEKKKPTKPEDKATIPVDITNSSSAILPTKMVDASIKKALSEAKKAGKTDFEIAFSIGTGDKNPNSMLIDLPKATLDSIIKNKVSQTTFILEDSAISFTLNLAAITEINRQAQGDVSLMLTFLPNTSGLSAATKAAIGNHSVVALRATYQNGEKSITDFGKTGKVMIGMPSSLNSANLIAAFTDINGEIARLVESNYTEKSKLNMGGKAIDGTFYHFGGEDAQKNPTETASDKNYITHKIVRGDTLWGLSRKHKCTVADIAKLNNIKNPSRVPVGTKIMIPQK